MHLDNRERAGIISEKPSKARFTFLCEPYQNSVVVDRIRFCFVKKTLVLIERSILCL